jgi:hypothetical protein
MHSMCNVNYIISIFLMHELATNHEVTSYESHAGVRRSHFSYCLNHNTYGSGFKLKKLLPLTIDCVACTEQS